MYRLSFVPAAQKHYRLVRGKVDEKSTLNLLKFPEKVQMDKWKKPVQMFQNFPDASATRKAIIDAIPAFGAGRLVSLGSLGEHNFLR